MSDLTAPGDTEPPPEDGGTDPQPGSQPPSSRPLSRGSEHPSLQSAAEPELQIDTALDEVEPEPVISRPASKAASQISNHQEAALESPKQVPTPDRASQHGSAPIESPQLPPTPRISSQKATPIASPQVPGSGRASQQGGTPIASPQVPGSGRASQQGGTSIASPQVPGSGRVSQQGGTPIASPQVPGSGRASQQGGTPIASPQVPGSGRASQQGGTPIASPQVPRSGRASQQGGTPIASPQVPGSGRASQQGGTPIASPQVPGSGRASQQGGTPIASPQVPGSGRASQQGGTPIASPQVPGSGRASQQGGTPIASPQVPGSGRASQQGGTPIASPQVPGSGRASQQGGTPIASPQVPGSGRSSHQRGTPIASPKVPGTPTAGSRQGSRLSERSLRSQPATPVVTSQPLTPSIGHSQVGSRTSYHSGNYSMASGVEEDIIAAVSKTEVMKSPPMPIESPAGSPFPTDVETVPPNYDFNVVNGHSAGGASMSGEMEQILALINSQSAAQHDGAQSDRSANGSVASSGRMVKQIGDCAIRSGNSDQPDPRAIEQRERYLKEAEARAAAEEVAIKERMAASLPPLRSGNESRETPTPIRQLRKHNYQEALRVDDLENRLEKLRTSLETRNSENTDLRKEVEELRQANENMKKLLEKLTKELKSSSSSSSSSSGSSSSGSSSDSEDKKKKKKKKKKKSKDDKKKKKGKKGKSDGKDKKEKKKKGKKKKEKSKEEKGSENENEEEKDGKKKEEEKEECEEKERSVASVKDNEEQPLTLQEYDSLLAEREYLTQEIASAREEILEARRSRQSNASGQSLREEQAATPVPEPEPHEEVIMEEIEEASKKEEIDEEKLSRASSQLSALYPSDPRLLQRKIADLEQQVRDLQEANSATQFNIRPSRWTDLNAGNSDRYRSPIFNETDRNGDVLQELSLLKAEVNALRSDKSADYLSNTRRGRESPHLRLDDSYRTLADRKSPDLRFDDSYRSGRISPRLRFEDSQRRTDSRYTGLSGYTSPLSTYYNGSQRRQETERLAREQSPANYDFKTNSRDLDTSSDSRFLARSFYSSYHQPKWNSDDIDSEVTTEAETIPDEHHDDLDEYMEEVRPVERYRENAWLSNTSPVIEHTVRDVERELRDMNIIPSRTGRLQESRYESYDHDPLRNRSRSRTSSAERGQTHHEDQEASRISARKYLESVEINTKFSTLGRRPFAPSVAAEVRRGDIVKFIRHGGKVSKGLVHYVGHLPGRRDIYLGLELEREEGRHDGVFEGKRFFTCKRHKGVFVAFGKVLMCYGQV